MNYGESSPVVGSSVCCKLAFVGDGDVTLWN